MTRALTWLALSATYVAAVVAAYGVLGSPVILSGDGRFLVEQLATVATALTAAVAAFRDPEAARATAGAIDPNFAAGSAWATALTIHAIRLARCSGVSSEKFSFSCPTSTTT
jgi:hypothetical protein